jgi:orotate phosphoribosyltransferase
VLIIDDVMSAGTSVRESIAMIRAAGGTPAGVAIALDRQERASEAGQDAPWSAVQVVTQQLQLPVAAIATLDALLAFLEQGKDPALTAFAAPVQAYRLRYGV